MAVRCRAGPGLGLLGFVLHHYFLRSSLLNHARSMICNWLRGAKPLHTLGLTAGDMVVFPLHAYQPGAEIDQLLFTVRLYLSVGAVKGDVASDGRHPSPMRSRYESKHHTALNVCHEIV